MAGFFFLLAALGAVIVFVVIAAGAYQLIVRPLFWLARFALVMVLYIPVALLAAIFAPIPPLSRGIARAYRVIHGDKS